MSGIPDRLATALADRYRIEREIGAGGMATVYLAEDLRHKRRVAIKVLKPDLAAVLGAERFVTEIKTTAALQHPHILPLFDSGTAGERDGGTEFLFYVMPYVEGETLRAKLDRETQLGIEEATRIAREVADALDYAHRHGVVHRDIKPENILLHDGRATVADFGIALAVSGVSGMDPLDIWTLDLSSGVTSRLTTDPVSTRGVVWAPDSRTIAFRSDRLSRSAIFSKTVGAAADSLLYEHSDAGVLWVEHWSHDGGTLIVRRTPDSLFALPLTGERALRFLADIRGVDQVRLSPDGRRIAYGSSESGRWEVYVASYPALDDRRQVSANGGRQPRWRGDSEELFFFSDDGRVMAAAANPASPDDFLAPRELFQSPITMPNPTTDQIDVTRDGQRFLFAAPVSTGEDEISPLVVVLNWTRLLAGR